MSATRHVPRVLRALERKSRQEVDAARLDESNAKAVANRERELMGACTRDLEEVVTALRGKALAGASLDPATIRQLDDVLLWQRERISVRGRELESADEIHRQTREGLKDALQQSRILEKLRERTDALGRREDRRREEREQDDWWVGRLQIQ